MINLLLLIHMRDLKCIDGISRNLTVIVVLMLSLYWNNGILNEGSSYHRSHRIDLHICVLLFLDCATRMEVIHLIPDLTNVVKEFIVNLDRLSSRCSSQRHWFILRDDREGRIEKANSVWVLLLLSSQVVLIDDVFDSTTNVESLEGKLLTSILASGEDILRKDLDEWTKIQQPSARIQPFVTSCPVVELTYRISRGSSSFPYSTHTPAYLLPIMTSLPTRSLALSSLIFT